MQNFEELTCGLCQRQYSVQGDLVPRLLPECGHTYCTQCLNLLLSQSSGDFYCPEDNTNCVRKSTAEEYPKNFALLRLAEKTMAKQKQQQFQQQYIDNQQPQAKPQQYRNETQKDQSQSSGEEELCQIHQRKLEIICIDDKERICSNCALFGQHRNHDIRMEADVLNEIQIRTECLMEMFQLVEVNQLSKVDQNQVEQLLGQFRSKSQQLKQLVSTKFKELKASLKIQEQQTEAVLNKNITFIERQFQIIRDVPQRLFDDADKWLKNAKVQLDNFTRNSENPTFIAFDMLENKKIKNSDDIIQYGEKILMQLDGQKNVSAQRLDDMIAELSVEFDQNALRKINECCKCNLVSGIPDNFDATEKYQKMSQSNMAKAGGMTGTGQGNLNTQISRSSNIFGEDDNDLLTEVSFAQMEHHSPSRSSNPIQDNIPVRKSSTILSTQKSYQENIKYQPPPTKVISQEQNEQIINQVKGADQKEDLDEDLINEIENYLKDVMEQNEKVIDISETFIGNYGAKCVAAVLTLCDGLEEIRLSNCGIKDDGAQDLFEELKTTESVAVVDLNKNPLTEKCFDSLAQLLQVNKRIERVELKGLTVRNKFSMNKIKGFTNKIIM